MSLANVGSGFWGWLEPEKTLPLVNELLPGKARESIIRDAVSYYAELPDEIPQSKAWFEQLSPELRTLARKSTEGRMFIASSSEVLNSLRSAWDEVEREGR